MLRSGWLSVCRCARGSSPAVAAGNGRGGLAGDGTNSYSCTARGTPSSEFTPSGLVAGTFDAYGGQATAGVRSCASDALGRVTADVNTSTLAGHAFTYVGATGTVASDGSSACTWDPSGSTLAGVGVPGGGTTGVLALTDSHGDVVGQFTASGTAVSGSAGYDPWGTVTATAGTLAGQLGYQSGWTDGATGKVAMGARWYSPSMGDFISADSVRVSPVPDPAMGNPFAYVGDSPLSSTDPTGHCGGLFSFLCSVMHAVAHVVHPVAHPVAHPAARPRVPFSVLAPYAVLSPAGAVAYAGVMLGVAAAGSATQQVADAASRGARARNTRVIQAPGNTTRTSRKPASYESRQGGGGGLPSHPAPARIRRALEFNSAHPAANPWHGFEAGLQGAGLRAAGWLLVNTSNGSLRDLALRTLEVAAGMVTASAGAAVIEVGGALCLAGALESGGTFCVAGAAAAAAGAGLITAGAAISANGLTGIGRDLGTMTSSDGSASNAINKSRDIGMDPATGKFRQSEYDTAIRVEQERGIVLERSTDPKLDWVDPANGDTYDAVGNFNSRHFNDQWSNLQARIKDHMLKADFVPVDVSQFTKAQIAQVQQFIKPLGPRVFTVGQ